jgi:hypothetical protein
VVNSELTTWEVVKSLPGEIRFHLPLTAMIGIGKRQQFATKYFGAQKPADLIERPAANFV